MNQIILISLATATLLASSSNLEKRVNALEENLSNLKGTLYSYDNELYPIHMIMSYIQ